MFLKNFVLFTFFILYCQSTTFGQTTEELKRQKSEEQERKLKLAKAESLKTVIAWGYHGGTMAPFGVAFYMMNPKKEGFYSSIRFGREPDVANKPFKGLNLNVGVTKNLIFPVAAYVAGGISDYNYFTKKDYISPYSPEDIFDDHWEFGLDVSFGLIFHFKGLELQSGISLFNFTHPEFCFGIGYNLLRKMK